MENLDSLSDCSESSRNSISLSTSTLSIASGFSEYQNEFIQLKDLVAPGINNPAPSESKNHAKFYEIQFQNMKNQLRKLSEENDKLKNDCVRAENAKEQLKNTEINKLLIANNHLEASLEAANKQIQRLLDGQASKHIPNVADQKILTLENDNQTLREEISDLSRKLRINSSDKIRLENDFNNIKTEIAELKLEYNANTNCIVQLKAKIVEQHVQLEDSQNQCLKLTNALDVKSRELETTKKMENWYKEQLHQIQKERNILSEKIILNREALIRAENLIENLKLEMQQWKNKLDNLQLQNLKEKEILLKQVKVKTPSNDENVIISYQTIVKDLNTDLDKMKLNYNSQQTTIAELNNQKLAADKKFLSLERAVQEKQIMIYNLQEHSKSLEKSLESAINCQKQIQKNLEASEKNGMMLSLQLNGLKDDKILLENTVKGFKDQFMAFKSNYQALNEKLREKNNKVADLESSNEEYHKTYKDNTESLNKKHEEICILKQTLDKRDLDILNLEQNRNYLEEKVNVLNTHSEEIIEKVLSKGQNNFYDLAKPLGLQEFVTVDKNDDFLIISYLNVMQLFQYFLKLIEVHDDMSHNIEECIKNCNSSKNQNIQALSTKIFTTLSGMVQENHSNGQEISSFKQNMKKAITSVKNLSDKCKLLQEKCENSYKLLEILNEKNTQGSQKEDEINHVKALLKVKEREQLQQQKRFERNYHVLLQKVKEHMRGRSIAKKQSTHFQEMYQRLSAEYNTLKLDLNAKELEIKSFQELLQTHMNIEDQLKSSILVLNNELDLQKTNDDHAEKTYIEELKKKNTNIKTLETEIGKLKSQLSCLHTSHLEKDSTIVRLSEVNNELTNRINKLEKDITEEKCTNEKLKISFALQNDKKLNLEDKCDELSKLVEDLKEMNKYYSSELETLKLCTQQKSEEILELQRRKSDIECCQHESTKNLQNLVTALKSQLVPLQNDLLAATREKHFLQRLCNDLKVALQIHVNHNKVVKKYVSNIFKEKKSNSLPFSLDNFQSPLKCNDEYIDKILDEHNFSCETTLSDIQSCLLALRNEIIMVQREIFDKNCT